MIPHSLVSNRAKVHHGKHFDYVTRSEQFRQVPREGLNRQSVNNRGRVDPDNNGGS